MGWEHLVIRPDTKLTAADKRRVEKAIRRAKKEGKIAKTAQQTIPDEEIDVYKRQLLRRSHVLIVCGDEVDESGKNDIAVAPVSYTHLDVYKRQPLYWDIRDCCDQHSPE